MTARPIRVIAGKGRLPHTEDAMRRFRVYRPHPPEEYFASGAANPPEEVQFEGVVFSDGTVCGVRHQARVDGHMTRKLSALEVRLTLAGMARIAPDDLDGYVIVLAKGDDVTAVMTNSDGEATLIMLLARAIEQRSRAVGMLEESASAQQ